MMGCTSTQRRIIRFAHNMIQWIEWCVLMELWLLHWVYIDLIAPKMKYICNNNFTGLKTSLFFSLMMRLMSNVYFGDWNRQQCSHLLRAIRLKIPPQLIIIRSFFSRFLCFGSFFPIIFMLLSIILTILNNECNDYQYVCFFIIELNAIWNKIGKFPRFTHFIHSFCTYYSIQSVLDEYIKRMYWLCLYALWIKPHNCKMLADLDRIYSNYSPMIPIIQLQIIIWEYLIALYKYMYKQSSWKYWFWFFLTWILYSADRLNRGFLHSFTKPKYISISIFSHPNEHCKNILHYNELQIFKWKFNRF